MKPVTQKKCNFCDRFADVYYGKEGLSVPACMRCLDEQLELNLKRIDNANKNRLRR